jgi:hypothetical protein
MLPRLAAPLVIVGLGLIFFAELLRHPTQTLYADNSDLLAYHLPVKHFLVRSWQQNGELPLWSPCSLGGMPFVHDVQVSAFYPPHLPLYLLPEGLVGCTLSWIIVLHVIAAGLGMYAYARFDGLSRAGALVAGVGYMFAGKWLLHLLAAGHLNAAPLAWLPLVLLGLEAALRRGLLLYAAGAGAAFALILLGSHPQLTFYAGLFVAVWTLGPALEQAGYYGGAGPRSRRRTAAALGRWALAGGVAAAVAVGLSAVQLLPTLEAAQQTSRESARVEAFRLGDAVWSLLRLVAPPPGKFGWEHQAGLGLTWVLAAALGVLGGRGRVRFQAAVGVGLLVFALGGWVVLQGLPGFRLFRIPTRMLLFAAVPLSLLAGSATDRLFAARQRPAWLAAAARPLGGLIALALVLAAGQPVFASLTEKVPGYVPGLHPYWVTLALAVLVFLRLLYRFSGSPGPAWKLAWGAVLLADLWGLGLPLVAVRPEADLFAPSECVTFLQDRAPPHSRVLDRDVSDDLDDAGKTPVGVIQPLLRGLEPVRGYNPLDVYRYKEYLRFVSDDGTPPLPTVVLANFPIVNKPLLDLLGTRYLVQPSSRPPETDGWTAVATDPHPRAYCFLSGGVEDLPPYTVYENKDAFPRAFVVPGAAPLPERRQALAALKATDFRRTVLLDGLAAPRQGGGSFREAVVQDYRPNRVAVAVDADAPGYLVLADVWFPGWVATVNGAAAVPVHRADYLFRAVEVPAGHSEVVFTFEPASYRRGRLVSAAVLAAFAAACALAGLRSLRRRAGAPAAPVRSPVEV